MAYTQTAEFEIASKGYVDIQDTTDGSTTYSEGELAAINDCVCFPLSDIAVSTKFAAVLIADKVSALKAAEAMAAGQKLYWDNSASKVTVTDTTGGLPNIGYVLEDAASGDNAVIAYFDGRGLALT
jgi:predicted RecA/RadA family phage recombinase